MRIGLLTYHHTGSYGATLQTYATCKILCDLGHQVEIIDYRLENKRSWLYKALFYFKERNTKRLWKTIYPSLSTYYPNLEALRQSELKYDCIMVGSDQTWNPAISRRQCLAYFLDFGPANIKRISYASSFGVSNWPEEYIHLVPKIKELLNRFNAISTREKEGQALLRSLFEKDSCLVVDPTILMDDYSDLYGEIRPNGKLITFIMNRSNPQLGKVRDFARFYGKKPIMTSTIYPYRGFTYQYPPGIGKWLRNIGGADFVIVDSFHALVFCLKFHKEFLVITPDNGRNSRLLNLLNLVGLRNRFYYDYEDIPYSEVMKDRIDYKHVDEKLDICRMKSIKFLKDNL